MVEDGEDEGNTSNSDLAAIGVAGVRARHADDIEQEVVEQFTQQLEGPSSSSEDTVQNAETICDIKSSIDGLLHLPAAIKHGDLTPFEVQRQNEAAYRAAFPGAKPATTEEHSDEDEEEWTPIVKKRRKSKDNADVKSEDEYVPSDEGSVVYDSTGEWDIDEKPSTSSGERKRMQKDLKKYADDGDDASFEARIRRYFAEKEHARLESGLEGVSEEKMKKINEELKITAEPWNKLYKYQKTGVRWMAELRDQRVGGILADEMGLGKTVQTAMFLRAIAESGVNDPITGFTGLGPSLLVCPATLLQQWVREVHTWHPLCRVAVLHSCGSHKGSNASLIRKMTKPRSSGSLLVTSYSTFYKERKNLTEAAWHYAILDEGHKIRNPEALITLSLKELRTPFRLLLSGSPMQNALKELWSLVDFVFPGRLGSLKTFSEKFAVPITIGGYANATEVQTETAYKCALVLRDAINPYFLRRMKKDVQMALELPGKSEQILFCDLAPPQRSLYKEYLSSRECRLIRAGRLEAFAGLTLLRKICNHPDLVTGGPDKHGEADLEMNPHFAYGWPERSGKAQVVRSLLQLWKGKNGGKIEKDKEPANKVLLFSQSRRMLTILEQMLILDGHSYLRMDGGTPIGKRQQLVAEFNQNPETFVFLLTTRVGGVGINLTAANKVLIFDPDWNPSTDAQARERSWRIGQKRDVTVYRLISTGTIEEKIYHRQIFKQFLANRVLKDPKQRRFFKTNDLHDLFTLSEISVEGGSTDTGAIFCGQTHEITKDNFFDKHEKERERNRKERRKRKDKEEEEEEEEEEGEESLSEERRRQLREMAAKISKNMESLVPVKRKRNRDEAEEGEIKEEVKEEESHGLFEKRYTIPYLMKQKKAKKRKDEKEKTNDKSSSDDYVLGQLLSKSGVRSVVRHDDVVGEGKGRSNRDERLAVREADNVARQAAAAVRKRPRLNFLQRCGFNVPGQETSSSVTSSTKNAFGQGGALKVEREEVEEGMSGGGLLEAIRARKAKQGGTDQPLPSSSKYTKLAESMKTFLRDKWGKASTERIVERFKKEIPGRDQLHFRSILKQIATFDAVSREWTLKEDFD